ncbi:BRCA1-associated RING domain protein 1-like isoform X2 [Gossypium hirsutum]|uniref:BRCA1-associated RING domain protein 1-like isoform X2 n=1 Tax=Gossypium hirsutum TaxID=3635 RepID=A0ABM2ZH20_GOSHI|nr:BRCA1-associated RING domain protein 1-like isoform X2 [Gossypium hirsutum]
MPNIVSEVNPNHSGLGAVSESGVATRSANSYFLPFLMVKFAKMISVTVSKFWRPDVTHVIASTDENGACTRTLKVLVAISNGKWVLKLNCK